MKIIARHMTADFYNCKSTRLDKPEIFEELAADAFKEAGLKILVQRSIRISEDHFVTLIAFDEGHSSLHVYTDLKYIGADIYVCAENAEPEFLFKAIRKYCKPDKIKTTLLKRGDFGTVKDAKPKIKTRTIPLRKLHNTGAKVIRILARRSK